jgi:DNA-binding NtrC family response regulator
MSQIYILCVDDEADVLDVVIRDLAGFEDAFPIESAENVPAARAIIERILRKGDRIGLIYCDHVMPGENGVEFLVELQKNEVLRNTRKILLTGQAGLDATITAVNKANLAHYVAKPWDSADLVDITRKQLANFVVNEGVDPRPFSEHLDPVIMAEAIRKGLLSDR